MVYSASINVSLRWGGTLGICTCKVFEFPSIDKALQVECPAYARGPPLHFKHIFDRYQIRVKSNNNIYLYCKTRAINCTILIKNTSSSWSLKITMKLNELDDHDLLKDKETCQNED